MLTQSADQAACKRLPTTDASGVDWRVRDTYSGLLSLPVPERFIDLVQDYPEQQETGPAKRGLAGMTRYYIDVWSRFGVEEDCDGMELPDLASAHAEALKVGHRLLERWADMPPDGRSEIIIEVIDERLKKVLRVSLPEMQQNLSIT